MNKIENWKLCWQLRPTISKGDRERKTLQWQPRRVEMIEFQFFPKYLFMETVSSIFLKFPKLFSNLEPKLEIWCNSNQSIWRFLWKSESTSKNPFKLSTWNWSFQFERQQIILKTSKISSLKVPFYLDFKGFCNNAKVDLVKSNNIFWKNRLCVHVFALGLRRNQAFDNLKPK